MKAIIIEDKDSRALLDQLKLEAFNHDFLGGGADAQEAWYSIPADIRKQMVERLHRKFHYIVCRWLQEQGASTTS